MRVARQKLTASISILKINTFIAALIIGLFAPMLSSPIQTHADASDCQPDTMNLAAASWLTGMNGAVNVCSPDEGSTNVCVPVTGAPADPTHGCTAGQVWSGTEWQCVEMVNRLYLTKGWTTTTWRGNGGGTDGLIYHLPSNLTNLEEDNGHISSLNSGDVITLNNDNDANGHAGIINTITYPNNVTTANIINQNAQLNSSAKIVSGTLAGGNATMSMNAWAGYHVQAIVHHPSGGTTNPNPLHISAIHTGGGAEAKEGSLSAGWWGLSSNGATQVMEDGTLNGLVYNGMLLVNQGHPTNNWIIEDGSGSVVQASISDAVGTMPIRIGLLRNDGTFWVSEGLNSSSWVLEQGGVVAGYVSGNRIAVLLSDGTFEVKEGGLGAGWVVEDGSVSQAVISGGSGGLIGVVIGGTLLVKQGAIDSGWVTEQGAVANAQLSNATSITPARIGYIDTSGNYWVKEGIGGGWVLEQGGVTNAALSGNLIGVVMSDGTYDVKQGSLGAGWVTEDGLITQNALWSGN